MEILLGSVDCVAHVACQGGLVLTMWHAALGLVFLCMSTLMFVEICVQERQSDDNGMAL